MHFCYPLAKRYVNRFGRVFGEKQIFEKPSEGGTADSDVYQTDHAYCNYIVIHSFYINVVCYFTLEC
jgi:hypothetical protein